MLKETTKFLEVPDDCYCCIVQFMRDPKEYFTFKILHSSIRDCLDNPVNFYCTDKIFFTCMRIIRRPNIGVWVRCLSIREMDDRLCMTFPNVILLVIYGKCWPGSALSKLTKGFGQLQCLKMRGVKIEENEIASLPWLRKLKELDLDDCHINLSNLDDILALTHLRKIRLHSWIRTRVVSTAEYESIKEEVTRVLDQGRFTEVDIEIFCSSGWIIRKKRLQ